MNDVNNFVANIISEKTLGYILGILFLVALIFILLILVDLFSNYDPDKIAKKITIRTNSSSFGGGQEAYLRYWVWQIKKRKICRELLCSKYPSSKAIYPKAKWLKKGKVKFVFRRESWVII